MKQLVRRLSETILTDHPKKEAYYIAESARHTPVRLVIGDQHGVEMKLIDLKEAVEGMESFILIHNHMNKRNWHAITGCDIETTAVIRHYLPNLRESVIVNPTLQQYVEILQNCTCDPLEAPVLTTEQGQAGEGSVTGFVKSAKKVS